MIRRARTALLAAALLCAAATLATAQTFVYPTPAECASSSYRANGMTLAASKDTIHWGYTYKGLPHKMVAKSGDVVTVEMITHHAGDDYDKMIKGDPGVESIYKWDATMNVPNRGASGSSDGVHVLTGPIYVCGAEPGDVLQVDILDLNPRVNPATGKTFGSNAAAWWGYQFRAGFVDKVAREVITIYEIIKDATGKLLYAVPDYQFRWNDPAKGYTGPTTSCVPTTGSITTLDGGRPWNNTARAHSPGVTVPCIGGQQKWSGIYYTGLITQHPTGTEDYSIRGKFRVPINLHIGNIGLATTYDDTVDSVPPGPWGGNMDDRRIGIGASLFLPVQVKGALLSAGDAHAAQGDSELDGTGIETSITGRFKLTLHKKSSLPKKVQSLTFPLLENANEFVVHGYTYTDYLKELNPPGTIYGLSTLDRAMTNCYLQTRDWMMRTFELTEDQAVTAITVAVDFGITQVVDGNWGIHAIVPKYMFQGLGDGKEYSPRVMQGTSVPSKVKVRRKFATTLLAGRH